MIKRILFGVIVLLLATSLMGVFRAKPDEKKKESILPRVENFNNFKKLIADAQKRLPYFEFSRDFVYCEGNSRIVYSPNVSISGNSASDYSKTNVQVEGVDEADRVKTDGEYIYVIDETARKLTIVKAYPAQKMHLVSTIKFEEDFYPKEFYVDSKYLVVIGENKEVYKQIPYKEDDLDSKKISNKILTYPPYYTAKETVCFIYDISDKANPKNIRKITLDGRYLTSRKIKGSIHIVSLKSFPYYLIDNKNLSAQDFMPSYSDTAMKGAQKVYIGFNNIRYVPNFADFSYTLVGSFELESDTSVSVECILGAGSLVYCSKENLYICAQGYKKVFLPAKTLESFRPRYYYKPETMVYKFALSKGRAEVLCAGFVEGKVLNQFSMDEYDGYFRIATTVESHYSWEGDFQEYNAVYVLDKNLKIVGKLDKIAKGESIYSARFIGTRLYLVTFKALDPFFVISLENPQKPEILGYLKIPGYSTYLHPYDQNHIIGFGKDAEDLNEEYAIPLGLKIAMFNVEDVENPKELFKVIIGGKGTNSELLNNHKALLFDKTKNIFAFSVEVYDKKGHNFTGAFVYSIDLKEGFVLRGKISHEIDDGYCEEIDRLLYIGDVLYSVSNSMIKASSLESFKEIARLRLD
ncbi:C-terminal beta-propeller domain containing secreted protein [Caldicellulosiruptor saccharolyticus DSM 8903]|uniref:C-terminal beta-propeller domain containing secreted protein n=1 Tax=Caldicellulosiruptor saccharolyticus (strain ATCC 43494 / DSM 8903 / Tp8T 6331) TaxID=351627 RepID=A4XFI7_CALS8|nr:beta-propeller domain-containing protein [Caldicellulosiruptor saccharolyticus]ABP65672.1 C-terminal beta-propeller domain containing secreted protein [Caldicellulosiruptor saccharolyticus DSM 8903]